MASTSSRLLKLWSSALLLGISQLVQADTSAWQDISQQQLVYLQVSDAAGREGTVVLQLADAFTPLTSARFRQLVQQRFYDGLPFYRVIDQFVLQAGLPEGESHPQQLKKSSPALPAEFSWPVRSADPYTPVQSGDLLAEETGFNQGFAVAREQNQEWLVHCPGVVNMARANEPDTGVADIAIMMGQATRHLDKNMSAFGKVIWGQYAINRIRRGDTADGGVIGSAAARTVIKQARLGTDLAPDRQLQLEWLSTTSSEFSQSLAERRSRTHVFYQHKGNGNMDVCYPQVPVRVVKAV